MMFIRCFVFYSCILFSTLTYAAHDTYVFFDFPSCHTYITENDPLTYNKNYEQWAKKLEQPQFLEKKLNETTYTYWSVYHMNDGERMGLCRKTNSNEQGTIALYCHEESYNNFPLAGASYSSVKNNKGKFLWFKCVSGCKEGTPKEVYSEGYEADENDPSSLALQKAYSKHENTCPNN